MSMAVTDDCLCAASLLIVSHKVSMNVIPPWLPRLTEALEMPAGVCGRLVSAGLPDPNALLSWLCVGECIFSVNPDLCIPGECSEEASAGDLRAPMLAWYFGQEARSAYLPALEGRAP